MRGKAYTSQGKVDAAIQRFSKAIKLDPNDHDAYTNRGHAYREKERWDAAIQDFSSAIDLYCAKDDADAEKAAELYNYRGVVWFCKEDKEKALADLEEATRLDPGNKYYEMKEGKSFDQFKSEINDVFSFDSKKQVVGLLDDVGVITAAIASIGSVLNKYKKQ
jgi:tetratricopeptide (TPR) repeat protein